MGIGFHNITSPFGKKFHGDQTWACLDIIDETRELFRWHFICS
jgi:hypothetical protein